MMKFTLRQLQVFLATAHYQNISRAADSLSMSQSAASGALRDLEQRYDAQLFDRVGKRLQLNAHGHASRPLAESLMGEALEVEAALEQREAVGSLVRNSALRTLVQYRAKFALAQKAAAAELAEGLSRYPEAAQQLQQHFDGCDFSGLKRLLVKLQRATVT